MSGQLVFKRPENLAMNITSPTYPDMISIPRSRAINIINKSMLLDTLDELDGRKDPFVLQREYIMGGDPKFWGLMLDLIFPYDIPRHKPEHEPFIFKKGGYSLNPRRWLNPSDFKEVVDYLLFGDPKQMNTIVKELIYDRPGAPKLTKAEMAAAKRILTTEEKSFAKKHQAKAEEKAKAEKAKAREEEENNFINRSNNYYYNDNENEYNNNNNKGINLGYKNEEEEAAFGLMKASNRKKYGYKGGKRKTRKLKRKSKGKTAKWIR
jgi:hypothetical protein